MMIRSGLLSPFARLQAMHSTFSWSVPCESSGCFRSIITWFQLNLKFTKQKSKKKRSLVFGTSHANRLRKYQGNKLLAFVIFFISFFFLKFSSSHSWYRFCTRWCKQTAQTMCTQLNTPFTVVLCACGYGCVVLLLLALISYALFYKFFFVCLWSNLLWILWDFFRMTFKSLEQFEAILILMSQKISRSWQVQRK